MRYRRGDMKELLEKLLTRREDYKGDEASCYMFKRVVVLDRHSPGRLRIDMEFRMNIAKKLGANVAKILEQAGQYSVMERAPGKPMLDVTKRNANYLPMYKAVANAPQAQCDAVVNDIIIMLMAGLNIESAPQNILYSTKKGFSIVDLSGRGEIPTPEAFKKGVKNFCSCVLDPIKINQDIPKELKIKAIEKFDNSMRKYLTEAKLTKYCECARVIDDAVRRHGRIRSAVEFVKKALSEPRQIGICR